MRQLPGFAGSTGQAGVLTARDLLFPDSFADSYQLDLDSSQGPSLNAAYLSVSLDALLQGTPCLSLTIRMGVLSCWVIFPVQHHVKSVRAEEVHVGFDDCLLGCLAVMHASRDKLMRSGNKATQGLVVVHQACEHAVRESGISGGGSFQWPLAGCGAESPTCRLCTSISAHLSTSWRVWGVWRKHGPWRVQQSLWPPLQHRCEAGHCGRARTVAYLPGYPANLAFMELVQ